ncbi:MAG: potassium/proton antiporter [Bacteroidetes bacterium]|nr:potassium/proton antiporter [Bacteroidota bacterium]
MNSAVELLLIGSAILLFFSVLFSKLSTKIGFPTILVFIAIGMIVSIDGFGTISFKDPHTAQIIGSITLSFILFSGGLDTEFKHIKPILWNGVLLSTLGVLVTAFVIGGFITLISDFSFIEGLLVGAIVSSTDAAAVFSILRSRDMHLKANLSPTLELESGSNDAMAYLLTILFTTILSSKTKIGAFFVIKFFLQEMVIGAGAGFLMGKAMLWIINRIKLAYDALYPALVLSMILFTFSAVNFMHGNGYLAIYIAGMILGNSDFIHKKSLKKFYEGIGWLLQIGMFIALGLLVSPQKLVLVGGLGIMIALVLILIARPTSVFISLFFSKANFPQKLFVSWVGLRGAVPIVLATYPLLYNINKSETIFHIVFFVVLISMLIQGTTLYPVAKWLRLEEPPPKKKTPKALSLSEDVKSELVEIVVPKNSMAGEKEIVHLGLPKNALVVLIQRGKNYITPRGDTIIHSRDKLMVMTDDKNEIDTIKNCFYIKKEDI